MKNFVLIISLSLFITSCKQDSNEINNHAFVGGEIINPNASYVVFSRDNHTIDTVLLEDGDSLHFRLNTMEFDESLVFTGKGAKKNNYLINLFLKNEKEEQKMLHYCQLPPKDFDHKIDSFTKAKHEKLKIFERKNSTSEVFNEIADANIHYNYYANKEIYPFAYYGNNELKNLKSLPKDFYKYRDKVDYNNTRLLSYYPYYRFLNAHFNNIALTKHFKHSNDSIFVRSSLDYNLDRLDVIDSLVTNDWIKNTHIHHTARVFLNSNNNPGEISQFIERFLDKSTSESHKKEIVSMGHALIKLTPGNKIPDIALINNSEETTSLSAIIKRPTVVYFWTYRMRSNFKGIHKKAQKLKRHYPEIDFIAINAENISSENWTEALKQYKFPLDNEYRFVNPKDAKKQLVISRLNKVMLIDKGGAIVHGNANMSDHHFEEQLLGMLNQ